jgi:nicotinamidase-related amidase
MFNHMIDGSMKWIQKRLLKKYQFYPANTTAIVLIDVQNELLGRDSMGVEFTKQVSETIGFKNNLSNLIGFARDKGYQLVYVPYTKTITGQYPTPIHKKLATIISDETTDVFSGLPKEVQPQSNDMIILDRKKLSVFNSTSLAEKLKSEGIEHLVFAGPLVNVSLDSSVRDAVELGFHATLIKDCAAAFTMEEYRAAVDVTFPRFAQTVITFEEFKKSPS